METEQEKTEPTVIKKCFAMHCKHNTGGKCESKENSILVNGMCDRFAIRSREG